MDTRGQDTLARELGAVEHGQHVCRGFGNRVGAYAGNALRRKVVGHVECARQCAQDDDFLGASSTQEGEAGLDDLVYCDCVCLEGFSK